MAEFVDNEFDNSENLGFDDGIGDLDEPDGFDSAPAFLSASVSVSTVIPDPSAPVASVPSDAASRQVNQGQNQAKPTLSRHSQPGDYAEATTLTPPPRPLIPKHLPTIRPTSPSPAFGIFLVFLVSFTASLVVALIGVFFVPEAAANYTITLLSDLPVIFISFWVLYQWLPWKPKIMPMMLATLFGIAGLFAFIWISGQAAGIWMNTNLKDPAYGIYTDDLNSLSPVVYFVLTLCVAPIMEELFFRGVCERAFAYYITPFWAIVFQALIFAAMHLTFVHLIPTILLGLFNGWLTYRTGKLWPCILLHSANNALAIFAIDGIYRLLPWLFDDVLAWAGACIVAGAAVLLCMDAYQRDGGLLVRRRPVDFVQVSNEILDSNGNTVNPFKDSEPIRADLRPRARVIGQEPRPRRYDAPEIGSGRSQDPWPY